MEALTKMTVLFTLALAFSLVIERAIELFKALYDLIDGRFDLCKYWSIKTRKIQRIINERIATMEFLEPAAVTGVINKVEKLLLSREDGAGYIVPVLSGDLVRSAFVKIAAKVLGIVMGIGVAFLFSCNFLTILAEKHPVLMPLWLQTALSGAIIGLGSVPMHKVIVSLEKHREKVLNAKGDAQ